MTLYMGVNLIVHLASDGSEADDLLSAAHRAASRVTGRVQDHPEGRAAVQRERVLKVASAPTAVPLALVATRR